MNIVDETVGAEISESAPNSLENFSVADICCGSGLFLNTAFEKILNHYREYFKKHSPEDREELYRIGDEWRLTLKARRKILEEHIFGVDVDELAVEVARFSLLLKILEDQPKAAIDHYMDKNGTPILPDLGDNVKKGNSLVDENFYEFVRGDRQEDEILQNVVPFSFEDNFPDIMDRGGFDVIVSNPSYVRIQNMVKYLREREMEFYSSENGYICAQQDNYDKYYLFIERGLDLLSEDGSLGYIVPQKFLTLKSGKNLRKLISKGNHLRKIVHFGVNQIFEKSSNYTCLLFLEKSRNSFEVVKVDDLEEWKRKGEEAMEIIEGSNDELSEEPWAFVGDKVNELFERIINDFPTTLGDVADIFVGAQTSWNKGYIIKEWKEEGEYIVFEGPSGEERRIEKELVRPYFYTANKRKPSVYPISKIKENGRIIYPYKDNGDVIEPEELKNDYPRAWQYFESYKEDLKDRDLPESGTGAFYRYGRKQSIGKFSGKKIIVQVLSREARYGYDDSDIIVTGGGNGPFYNIRPYSDIQEKLDEGSTKPKLDIRYILAVISHPVMEAMVRSKSSFFRGGYYSHGKQFIKDIPIKLIHKDNEGEVRKYEEIVSLVDDHIKTYEKFRKSTTESRKQTYKQQLNVLKENIINKVTKLYELSEDEVEVAKGV